MCGNGAQTIGMKIMRARPMMVGLGLPEVIHLFAWFVAGLGSTSIAAAVLRTATGSGPITGTAFLVFV